MIEGLTREQERTMVAMPAELYEGLKNTPLIVLKWIDELIVDAVDYAYGTESWASREEAEDIWRDINYYQQAGHDVEQAIWEAEHKEV